MSLGQPPSTWFMALEARMTATVLASCSDISGTHLHVQEASLEAHAAMQRAHAEKFPSKSP